MKPSAGGSEPAQVTVVVSIHDAFEATQRCLLSLRRHCPRRHRVLLLDDASRDPRVANLLREFCDDDGRFEVQENPRNLGYTATVNRGCELAGRDDVVLLNSDTQVTDGWLDKLAKAAVGRPRVGTVTPVSNAAGAFSVPRRRSEPIPAGMSVDEMARLVEQRSPRLRPEVPTGNGFCLYVRRQCLDEVGAFDARRFPRGYGEENDFCMRALAAGFVHLIEDSTFVFHEHGASAGWRRRWLHLRARFLLRRLHPTYEQLVAKWLADDPLDILRDRLEEALGGLPPSSIQDVARSSAHRS